MNKNYTLAFQNLLYEYPLYKFVGNDDTNMDVLVIGWNEITETFVDQCLQAGQMGTYRINISVLSNNEEEDRDCALQFDIGVENNYLTSRCALKKFVNVNGSLGGAEDSYGTLNFYKGFNINDLMEEDEEKQDNVFEEILETNNNRMPHYFLISTNDNINNKRSAGKLDSLLNGLIESGQYIIFYISDEQGAERRDDSRVIPVNVKNVHKTEDIDQALDNMAFNVHLSWEDAINGDVNTEYEAFKNPATPEWEYDYLSSVAMALSIEYRLAEVGIDLKDREKAAAKFQEKLVGNQDMILHLSALEHRRWVLEKVMDGWQGPTPELADEYYKNCIKNCDTKYEDNKIKIHPCILKSTEQPLISAVYDRNPLFWDHFNSIDDGLNEITDELDVMSVKLHRLMYIDSQNYRGTDPLNHGTIQEIKELLIEDDVLSLDEDVENESSNPVGKAWYRFFICLSYILDGNWGYSKKYKYYRNTFIQKVADNALPCVRELEDKIKCLDKEVWSTIESNLYRDYRKYDEDLIKNIPFILTYRTNLTLAMPLSVTENLNSMMDILFQNVSSATVIKPKRIIYFLDITRDRNAVTISHIITTIRDYLKDRGMNCDVYIIAVASETLSSRKSQTNWRTHMRKLKRDEVIQDFEIYFNNSSNIILQWNEWVNKFCNEKNIKIDFYDGSNPMFKSMQNSMEFIQMIREQQIPYFEFDSRDKSFYHNENTSFLSYIRDNTFLGIDEMFALSGAENMEYNYLDLGEDYKTLWGIYKGKDWETNVVKASKYWKCLCNSLEIVEENIEVTVDNYVEMDILDSVLHEQANNWFKNDNIEDSYNKILKLITILAENQYLNIQYNDYEGIVGFSYANNSIHKLLTNEGKMLEEFVYYTLCESNLFDDIAAGYHFHWNMNSDSELIDSELDIVATRGFQSIIVECKDRAHLEQGFYYKLHSLVNLFGINSKGILVTTADVSSYISDNKKQEERGREMGIITIARRKNRSSHIDGMGDIEFLVDNVRNILR